MTLSPVFRSNTAVQLLREEGIWERMRPDIACQAEAVRAIHDDLAHVIGERYRVPSAYGNVEDDLEFLQEFFFLVLFRSIFRSLGVAEERLRFYCELDFCIKGTITAADNLFDEQDKSLLPLKPAGGSRNASILQLMCFERLIRRVLDRGTDGGHLDGETIAPVLRGLLDQMAAIGRLEGSEEGGVSEIPAPDAMVEHVHRVRGGALFALAFVAPKLIESGAVLERVQAAEPAVAALGTAFQIVDDLTDFEFDLGRKSHNLLVAQIRHHGSEAERKELDRLWNGTPPASGLVEGLFRDSALAVLERARTEARDSFGALAELGFWFPPRLSAEVVHAIVGLEGVSRIEALSGR